MNYDYELINVYKINDDIVIAKTMQDAIDLWKSTRLPLYERMDPTSVEEIYYSAKIKKEK